MMAIDRCQVEWCVVEGCSSIDIGTSIKKEFDALMMAIARCPMEWCPFVVINSIDVGTSIKKRPNLFQSAHSCSHTKRLIQLSLRRHDRDSPQRHREQQHQPTNQPTSQQTNQARERERERTQTRDAAAAEESERRSIRQCMP